MSDILAAPYMMLGIPIGDCNFHSPDATKGLPEPPYIIGSVLEGAIYGVGQYIPSLSNAQANIHGSGRSVYIPLSVTMDGPPVSYGGTGAGNSGLQSPPSHYGWIPCRGASGNTFNPAVVVVYACSLTSTQTAKFYLEQYSAAGALLSATYIGQLAAANTTSLGNYKSAVLTASSVTINASTMYFRLSVWLNAASTGSGWVELDFWGLGWMPKTTVAADTEYYIGRGFSFRQDSGAVTIATPMGSATYISQTRRGAMRLVDTMSMEFDRVSQAYRDTLLFLWSAGQGGAGAADKPVLVQPGQDLRGLPYPSLIVPNRPGTKQAFYARMKAFPLEFDEKAGYVESTSYFSGAVSWEELDF